MDFTYWEQYYKNQDTERSASLFSSFVLNFIKGRKILELGCGNGRDSLFFKKSGFDIVAIDQVIGELDMLRENFGDQNLQFISGDFTKLNSVLTDYFKEMPLFDCIYSRFTLHSITSSEEYRLLQEIPLFLRDDGILAIEARGLKNSLCGVGEKVEEDGFSVVYIHDNHYRRFIDFDALCQRLDDVFEILYAQEDRGFAPYGNDDDIFFRVIAKKREKR